MLTSLQKRIIRTAYKKDRAGYDRLALKQQMADCINRLSEDGQVGIAWTSIDCDCVRMSGSDVIPATLMHYRMWVERLYAGAEGPTSCELITPSEAREITRESLDLAMEAYENGHPHVVYA